MIYLKVKNEAELWDLKKALGIAKDVIKEGFYVSETAIATIEKTVEDINDTIAKFE